MKIATWNVNSIKARKDRALAWLNEKKPDVVCLQELKLEDKAVPVDEFKEAGYFTVSLGQKTYNGVAILSRSEPREVRRGLEDGVDDPQARLIEAVIDGVTVISAYMPNGQAVGTDKFLYKLEWLTRLRAYLDRHHSADKPLALCGDYNVAPDDLDVAFPDQWADSVLCHPDSRARLEALRSWGLVDVFRKHHPEGHVYSWWDYRMLAFPKGNGLRIDHIFATPSLAERSVGAEVDRNQRKGQLPSDHAPVIVDFRD